MQSDDPGERARPQEPCARDGLCGRMWTVAYHHAIRSGLTREEAEDCAGEFVLRMFRQSSYAVPLDLEGDRFDAWLHRCAVNMVIDCLRAKMRLREHEASWPETVSTDGCPAAWEAAGRRPDPEAKLLQEEFRKLLWNALDRLPAPTSELLVRHHLEGESIQELAAALGRTPHAVEQALWRARRRLAVLLERMGLTEAEIRSYTVPSPPDPSPPPPSSRQR